MLQEATLTKESFGNTNFQIYLTWQASVKCNGYEHNWNSTTSDKNTTIFPMECTTHGNKIESIIYIGTYGVQMYKRAI